MSEIFGRPDTGSGEGAGARARAGNGREAARAPSDIAGTLSALEDKLRALEHELTAVEEDEARLRSPAFPPARPSGPSRPSRATRPPRARPARSRSRAAPPDVAEATPSSRAATRGGGQRRAAPSPAPRGGPSPEDSPREARAPKRRASGEPAAASGAAALAPALAPPSVLAQPSGLDPSSPLAPTGELAEVVAEARDRLLALRAQVEDLLRFRDELRSSAQDLIADYQTVLDGEEAQEARVVLDVGPFAELATLASFEQALARIPEAQEVHVSSFQDGRAQVELLLSRPVPLVERMRAFLEREFRVTGAAPDRLTIELEPLATGTGAP